MTRALAFIAAAPLLFLAACDNSAFGGGNATPARPAAPVSRPDARLPAGFDLFVGHRDVVELNVDHPQTGGTIVSYSIIAEPQEVIDYYEHQAMAAGMRYAGRLDAGDQKSYDARKDSGTPRTMSVTALRKSEYTNVTLNFDVTR